MKFAINKSMAPQVIHLQKIYQVTIISDKGLVFMRQDDWNRICCMLDECSSILAKRHAHNTLSDNFCFWSECFIVAYDEEERVSCHAIVNFELFALCCKRCDIWLVLLPMWDLVSYVREFKSSANNNAMGCYIESRGDVLIDVEDN